MELNNIIKIIEDAGGVYRGLQKGDPGINVQDLVLFDDATVPVEKRSTMALYVGDVTLERVKASIRDMRRRYGYLL